VSAGAAQAGSGWESLARAAAAPTAAEESALLRELLAIELDGAPYALPVERVREIVRLRAITRVPRVPEFVRGVIALRGEVIQVIDLRRRMGLPPAEPTRKSRIVVLHAEDGRIAGLLVDAVHEVLRLPESAIRAIAAGESGSVEALASRGREFVSIVDLDRVMDVDGGG
jgi:purine-binding chemotaxis protein CheW